MHPGFKPRHRPWLGVGMQLRSHRYTARATSSGPAIGVPLSRLSARFDGLECVCQLLPKRDVLGTEKVSTCFELKWFSDAPMELGGGSVSSLSVGPVAISSADYRRLTEPHGRRISLSSITFSVSQRCVLIHFRASSSDPNLPK
jgi:hypothetical protein